MKTILSCEELKPLFFHRLLEETDTPVITGIHLKSLSNLLDIDEAFETHADALQLSRWLNEEPDSYPIYRDMFRFPSFIQEILSFAKECALYSIPVSSLPCDTASEAELARIIDTALKLPLRERAVAEQLPRLLEKAASRGPIENSIRFEADPFRYRFLQMLREKAESFRDITEPHPAETIELRYAPGVRQEIEATAQDIIKKDRPCAVVLCSYDTQLPVLNQVFRRYGIPYSALRDSFRPAVIDAYISLASFALNQDKASLFSCMECNAFGRQPDGKLLDYLQHTMTGITFSPVNEQIDAEWFPFDHNDAVFMDQAAENYFSSVQQYINMLAGSATASGALTRAYDVLRAVSDLHNESELQAALSLRAKLNSCLPLIETAEDALFVLQEIELASVRRVGLTDSFCLVTDLSHPVGPLDTLYVLGCSGKQFPGVPVRKGLFDEAYTAKISSFPSMEERHSLWKNQLDWLENSSSHVIYSYAASDYQGREIQPAFEITSRITSAKPWQIDVLEPLQPKQHGIRSETAHALYEEDGRISSSVSRIERWFCCPYSYFLQNGLKIRKKMPGGLDAASFGNIQHALMDHAVKEYGKQYTDIDEAYIRSFVDPAFSSLRAMRPNETAQINLSEERMIHNLTQTLQFLKETEDAAPSWKPAATEHEFSHRMSDNVVLNGIIDRYDISGNSVRILDYKSSAKSLSEAKIKAGLQLQLLSYLIVASAKLNAKPAGAYYISMKNGGSACSAGKFAKTNKESVLTEDCDDPTLQHDAMVRERRIDGWSFEDPVILPDAYKTYFKPGSGIYDYAAVETCIKELYEYFYVHATDGEIPVDPVDSACMFCDYAAICRFHMPSRSPAPLVCKNTPFKPKKEEA